MTALRLAHHSAAWLRIVADRRNVTVAALARELRTPRALAVEVARLLDAEAWEDARALLKEKQVPPTGDTILDWLTRQRYATLKRTQDERKRIEQEQAWAEHLRLQQEARS